MRNCPPKLSICRTNRPLSAAVFIREPGICRAAEVIFAEFLKDAGADYLWSDDTATGYNPVAIERVLDRAVQAEFWIDPIYTERFDTARDLAAKDSRYGLFRAVKEGKVYISDARRNENGANPFFSRRRC